ncbi:MAG: ParB/RepB/Spo0J family partition protein [Symploca sp. SIO2C1]|nr:ParB/RepB/Spo0J family partition protein [Symploca sp. SIO2C1]
MSKHTPNTAFNLKGRSILGNLISEPSATSEAQELAAEWISVGKIRKGDFQPRQFFSQKGIDSLANSFKERGFRGTLNVRPRTDGTYELIAGERRWRAAKQAGLEKVRCVVEQYSDSEALEFALVENLQREDLSKLEETEGILHLIETKLGIARNHAVSIVRTEGHSDKRNRSDVAPSDELRQIEELLSCFNIELQTFRTKNLRTLSLPEELKQAHLERDLPYSSALELNKVKDEQERKNLLEDVIANRLSFRDIKERVRELTAKQKEEGEVTTLVRRLEATAKQAKKVGHLLKTKQKKKRLEKLLTELESLLDGK